MSNIAKINFAEDENKDLMMKFSLEYLKNLSFVEKCWIENNDLYWVHGWSRLKCFSVLLQMTYYAWIWSIFIKNKSDEDINLIVDKFKQWDIALDTHHYLIKNLTDKGYMVEWNETI